jgi:hypothetical protein
MRSCTLAGSIVLVAAFVLQAGCASKPPEPYSPQNMGPWEQAMPTAPAVTFQQVGLRQRIRLKLDYKTDLGDFVERIILKDETGTIVGNWKVPGSKVDLQVGFLLPEGTRTVTLHVTSSKHGEWRSAPIAVPEVKEEPKTP